MEDDLNRYSSDEHNDSKKSSDSEYPVTGSVLKRAIPAAVFSSFVSCSRGGHIISWAAIFAAVGTDFQP